MAFLILAAGLFTAAVNFVNSGLEGDGGDGDDRFEMLPAYAKTWVIRAKNYINYLRASGQEETAAERIRLLTIGLDTITASVTENEIAQSNTYLDGFGVNADGTGVFVK